MDIFLLFLSVTTLFYFSLAEGLAVILAYMQED